MELLNSLNLYMLRINTVVTDTHKTTHQHIQQIILFFKEDKAACDYTKEFEGFCTYKAFSESGYQFSNSGNGSDRRNGKGFPYKSNINGIR